MLKKSVLYLIPLVGGAILVKVYFLFQLRILKSLSIEQSEQLEKIRLEIYLGIPFLLLIALTYWLIILYDKHKKLKNQITNLKDSIKNKPPECPHCHSKNVVVDVKQSTAKKHKNDLRHRIVCEDCGRRFWSYKKPVF